MLPSGARSPWRQSLTARLIIINGGLVIGTALVLSALSLFLLSFQISATIQGRLNATRALAATIVDLRIEQSSAIAAQMSGDAQAVRAIQTEDPALVRSLLRSADAAAPFTWLLVVAPNGSAVSSDNSFALDASDQQALVADVLRGQSVRGLVRSADCRLMTLAAVPVRADGSVAGVLISASLLGTEFLDQVRTHTGASAWLLCGPQNLTAVAHGARLEVDAALTAAALQRREVLSGASRLDGVEGVGYYVPLVDFQDRVIGLYGLSQSVQDLTDTRDNTSRVFLLLVSVIALVVLAEAFLLARRITQPLIRLTEATQAIAGGDLETPVSEQGRDEIGGLALSFETMRVRLATTYADLARERNRYRDFLAMMPHEFRTPLAALAASLELLETGEDDLSGDQRQLVGSIHRSVIRLQSLVNNLLDTASIQAGHFQVHAQPSPLEPIIEEARLYIQPLLDQKQQVLRCELEPGLPMVEADARRITQVLINLVSNAQKYGPVGAPLTLTAARQDGMVRVAVADRGPGISSSDQSGLFQRFIRSSSKGTTTMPGIGFGLAITREIIEMHGGQVGIVSGIGAGTTVWFTLPVAVERDLGDEHEDIDR